MKYLGAITNDYDLVTKKYVDDSAKVVQTLTSGTEIGSVGGTKLYAPQGGGGGTSDYNSLSNRPQVNSTTLTGNKTLSDLGMKSEILDIFYPVGSYYETSMPATVFNPNTAWGGTWQLEASGQVHVSAGTGYTIGDTGGTDQIVYTPSGSTANVTLTAAQSGTQSQSITSNSGTSHSHGAGASTYRFLRIDGTGIGRDNVSKGSTTAHKYIYSDVVVGSTASTGSESSHTHSVTVAAKDATQSHNHTFTGTQVQLDNMQPYIVVNRWHRTA